MQESLITFETAKLAKEKEFDSYCYSWFFINSTDYSNTPKYYKEKCLAEYVEINEELIFHAIGGQHCKTVNSKFKNELNQPKVIACPTQSLLQKWLREKRIDITVITDWKKAKRVYYVGFSFVNDKNQIDIWFSKDEDKNKIEYSCYEDALEIGLQESLKLIEIVKE